MDHQFGCRQPVRSDRAQREASGCDVDENRKGTELNGTRLRPDGRRQRDLDAMEVTGPARQAELEIPEEMLFGWVFGHVG